MPMVAHVFEIDSGLVSNLGSFRYFLGHVRIGVEGSKSPYY